QTTATTPPRPAPPAPTRRPPHATPARDIRTPRPSLSHHPPPTQISTLSLHDALPISTGAASSWRVEGTQLAPRAAAMRSSGAYRSEEHTSELQSRENLVCRLLLEKKKAGRSRLGGTRCIGGVRCIGASSRGLAAASSV